MTHLASRLALTVITDAQCGEGRAIVDVVRAALAGGAPAIQLRAKEWTTSETVALARILLEETRRADALLLVNDRIDIALAAGADGVHLGDDDLPVSAARSITPPGFLLGRSVDTAELAREAIRDGADYLGVGPVAATQSKLDAGAAIGLEGVRRLAAAASHVPIVAIGGIDESNAMAIAEAGAAGVAVIRAVMLAPDPERTTAALLAAVRQGIKNRIEN